MAHENLPRRRPSTPETPHRSGSASFALLIRVATGLDQWAERDRHDQGPSKSE